MGARARSRTRLPDLCAALPMVLNPSRLPLQRCPRPSAGGALLASKLEPHHLPPCSSLRRSLASPSVFSSFPPVLRKGGCSLPGWKLGSHASAVGKASSRSDVAHWDKGLGRIQSLPRAIRTGSSGCSSYLSLKGREEEAGALGCSLSFSFSSSSLIPVTS